MFDQPVDLPDGVQGAALGAVGVLFRFQVGLEDRLQDQDHRHLHDAILDRKGSPAVVACRPVWGCNTRRTGSGRYVSLPQFLRQFVQPPLQPVRLDVLERLAVDPRRAAVGTAAGVGEFQHVRRYTLSYSA